jgi:hypothetical protein
MSAEPHSGIIVITGKAADPALRSPASEIDARRDIWLLGGVYLW